MDNLIDSHYLSLPSQGNVYLSARFQKLDGTIKIFVACLRRKVYIVEYLVCEHFMEPVTREIYFAYITSGSEITALEVFNRSKTIDDFAIGIITMRQSSEFGYTSYLNIYCEYDLEPGIEFNFDSVGQNCESLGLEFIPYGLHHVQISPHQIHGSYENLWLLPGSDCRIHAYRVNYPDRCHSEISVQDFFAEFENVSSIVLCIKVLYYNDYHNRVSCFGCENGHVRCVIVNCDNNRVLKVLNNEYENPVSSMQLFTLSMPVVPLKDLMKYTCNDELTFLEESPEVNLLVGNTLYHSEVFMDILKHDLRKRHCLPESNQYDVCLCSIVADLNFDGKKEIILGTYGEELLMFKYTDEEVWKFEQQKSVPNPVHKLFYIDLTEDGVCELVTVTAKGLHVYQHKLKDVFELFCGRLDKLEDTPAEFTTNEYDEDDDTDS